MVQVDQLRVQITIYFVQKLRIQLKIKPLFFLFPLTMLSLHRITELQLKLITKCYIIIEANRNS